MRAVLLDEGLPLRAAQWLRDNGIDAVHAREIGLTSAADEQILAAARKDGRICFTLDHDFHAILAESGATEPSIVLIRMQQKGYVETGQLIARVLRDLAQQLENGVAVTATRRGLRLRSLPLK
jgi:predicted nuclease of predicted toxin-antitoxin system